MKGLAKDLAVRTLGRLTTSSRGRIVILCYHSIHPRLSFASATPDEFAGHLEWLRGHCDVVPLNQVAQAEDRRGRDRPLVAITFDDGYEDNYTHALPLLEEHACPATFFVTVGLVDGDHSAADRIASVRQVPTSEIRPLSWGQVAELRSAGHSVGAHTWSHPNLGRLAEPEVRSELGRSKARLEEQLGAVVDQFAYPFGKRGPHFSSSTMELVAAEGYALAVSVLFRAVRKGDSRLALPRFFVARDSVETLAAKVYGRWDWLGLWQEHVPQGIARIVSPADFRV